MRAFLAVPLLILIAAAPASQPTTQPGEYPALRAQLERLSRLIKDLQTENASLKSHVAELEKKTPAPAPAPAVNPQKAGYITVGMTEAEVDRALGNLVKRVKAYSEDTKTVAYGRFPPVVGGRVYERYYTIYFAGGKVSDVVVHTPSLVED